MADLVAGLGASHAPSIAGALKGGAAEQAEWKPLFDAFARARAWLEALRPDALVVIYNDHADQFFLDRCPTFSIGVADAFEVSGQDVAPVPGHLGLATHLARECVAAGIDFTVCREHPIDDGVVVPLPLINGEWKIPIVPVNVNVVWDPRPSPARCWAMGEAVGEAVRSYPEDLRVAVIGTGGLSHELLGPSFGTIQPEWDRRFLEQMVERPHELRDLTMEQIEREGGHEAVEVVQWIAMRAALGGTCRSPYTCYFPNRLIGYAVACYEPTADGAPVAA